jgi:hypothetical protein
LPTLGGELTVSDDLFLMGNLSYSYTGYVGDLRPPEIIGDTDFNLQLSSADPLPFNVLSNLFHNGLVELSFSREGEISGSIYINTWHDYITMSINDSTVIDAEKGSDGLGKHRRNSPAAGLHGVESACA